MNSMMFPASSSPALQPPLILDERDHSRLRQLAEQALGSAPDVAQRLLDEVDRAEVLPPEAMPDGVVRIGSLVTYQDQASGSIRTIRLALPHEADVSTMRISVVSPIGAALIGLSTGQSIDWQVHEGDTRVLTVTRVHNDE
jgi:regulator of nucleoside diphosphate kinase